MRCTPALVGTPGTHDVDHVGASLVDFAVEGKRLVGHVKRGLPDATWMRTAPGHSLSLVFVWIVKLEQAS